MRFKRFPNYPTWNIFEIKTNISTLYSLYEIMKNSILHGREWKERNIKTKILFLYFCFTITKQDGIRLSLAAVREATSQS